MSNQMNNKHKNTQNENVAESARDTHTQAHNADSVNELDSIESSKHISQQDVSYQATQQNTTSKTPALSGLVRGVNELSVGISIVVAILIGIGIGILLERASGQKWCFWLGVIWGIGAAVLNLYRAYQRIQAQARELANNPRYSYKPDSKDEDEGDSANGTYY